MYESYKGAVREGLRRQSELPVPPGFLALQEAYQKSPPDLASLPPGMEGFASFPHLRSPMNYSTGMGNYDVAAHMAMILETSGRGAPKGARESGPARRINL